MAMLNNQIVIITVTGWWFQALGKIFMSWDYYSQYMEG